MSESLARSSRRSQKSTCRKCQRTVIVLEVDGRKIETDPELINVIPFEGSPTIGFARRVHADLCQRYQRDAELAKMRAEAKAAANPKPLKRPKPGRREPGQ